MRSAPAPEQRARRRETRPFRVEDTGTRIRASSPAARAPKTLRNPREHRSGTRRSAKKRVAASHRLAHAPRHPGRTVTMSGSDYEETLDEEEEEDEQEEHTLEDQLIEAAGAGRLIEVDRLIAEGVVDVDGTTREDRGRCTSARRTGARW